MNQFNFAVNQRDEACKLVIQYHYSHRVPSNIQLVGTWHEDGGLFGDSGECVAACFFSIPPTRWKEEVWELSRLVRKEDVRCSLTGLISKTCKWIKSKGLMDLLVSFADNTQGHHGGIYQASSWNYAGLRKAGVDGLLINGVFRPGRSCNSDYGTRSPSKLSEMKPHWDIKPHYDMGKYLYWKALNIHGERKARRLGLDSIQYAKPQTEIKEGTI